MNHRRKFSSIKRSRIASEILQLRGTCEIFFFRSLKLSLLRHRPSRHDQWALSGGLVPSMSSEKTKLKHRILITPDLLPGGIYGMSNNLDIVAGKYSRSQTDLSYLQKKRLLRTCGDKESDSKCIKNDTKIFSNFKESKQAQRTFESELRNAPHSIISVWEVVI